MPTEIIASGTSNTYVVAAGTTLDVDHGGIAISSTIQTGGVETVFGLDSGSLLSSGDQYVLAGGVASATVIDGGAEYVSSGGQALGVLVSAGTQYVGSSGLASAATLYTGATQSVLAGGTASATVVAGGADFVASGGSALSTFVSAGTEYVESSGFALGAAVYSGGSQVVQSGGIASATVLSGGTQYVASGGTTSGTNIGVAAPFLSSGASYGSEVVSKGGIASGTHVYVSGSMYVAGSAVSAALGGGLATVASGGVAIATVIDGGTADILSVLSNVYDLVSVGGTMTVQSGGVASNTEIVSGALVYDGGSVTGGVTLDGATADLTIGTSALPTAVVSGFPTAGTIDFATVAPADSGTITLDSANHRIAVVEGGGTRYLALDPSEDLTGAVLRDTPDTGSGTDVSIACFGEGTLIATPDGEVPVESLQPGQLVCTREGVAPLVWLGVQTIARRFADPLRALPIRVCAGALGDRVPKRDLFLSPGHALLLDGMLMEAHALLDGTCIVRAAGMAEIFRYWHVALPTHAVLLAEGAEAESFADGLEPFAFDSPAERQSVAGELPYPRVKAARQVPHSLRVRLSARAALLAAAPPRHAA